VAPCRPDPYRNFEDTGGLRLHPNDVVKHKTAANFAAEMRAQSSQQQQAAAPVGSLLGDIDRLMALTAVSDSAVLTGA
jgi:hypothetical protein